MSFERHQMSSLETAVWAAKYVAAKSNNNSLRIVTEAIGAADREVLALREGFAREREQLKTDDGLMQSHDPLKLVFDCIELHCTPTYPCVPCAIAQAKARPF